MGTILKHQGPNTWRPGYMNNTESEDGGRMTDCG